MKFCIIIMVLATLSLTVGRRRRSQNCREEKLERREELANMVFTGTVERLYRARSHVYRGVVRVKRVLKGDHSLAENTVIVEGFGDPHICYSEVRERDTRIFLVSQLNNGHLKLNSSVIRVSVTNLDRTVSAVRGLPLKRRISAPESQCEKMYCAYGAQCLVDQRTQQAHCRCQETCSDVFAPVCGSDGVTYSSDCQLRMASCTRQKRIFTRHQGPCGVKDPCEEKECHFGAQCRSSLDGKTAECVCPEKCATYGDGRGSRPVCGTDGRDYTNVCELRRASCIEMREIDVRYKGKCDPCEDVQCPISQVCQLDDNREPICRCNVVCTQDFRPVCGSDGKTYTNECILRVEACKLQKNLGVIYSGECSSGINPCELIKCGPGQECDIDRYGIASCQCPLPCEPRMIPVCGSNGRTFDNECDLRRQSCLLRQELLLIHSGECGERGPCHNHHCSYGAICVVKNGQPVCECPTCAEEFEPVCGSDGISYTNDCKLRREACEQKTEIDVAHDGLCNGCDSTECDFYALCESDAKGGAVCVCPQVCIKVDATVCGTDGFSYQNECELRVEACRKQQYVAVATKGFCDQCQHVNCKYGARCENGRCVCPTDCPLALESVCSSDGKTYMNECEMRRIACQTSHELSVQFFGICVEGEEDLEEEILTKKTNHVTSCQDKVCKYGGVCDFNSEGLPHCVCTFHCTSVREPVCGHDGRYYANDCRLKEESCKQQRRIVPTSREACSAHRDIPCDGEPPLVDPTTKKDYFCGKGPGAKLCPPKTYCHKTEHFAKCCREMPLIKTCEDTPFGCCPDKRTPVLGPNSGGCPSVCNCNRLGSYSSTCDPVTKQCPCKPGVGGLRCDRCEPGYWGLHKISKGNSGCAHCGCNSYGSIRDDCEQMTGRCVCKHGIQGMKCDQCPPDSILLSDGCADVSIARAVGVSCQNLTCYHGATCKENEDGDAQCICDFHCSPEDSRDSVCGSDGNSYGSECQLRLFSCRYQKPITIRFYGTCRKRGQADVETTTALPVKRSSRRRLHVKRLDSKATREVTMNLPQNLYLTTRISFTTPSTAALSTLPFPPDPDAEVEIPSFSGSSYLELPKLDANTRLSLELEFSTFMNDGIILYNGQTVSGTGDFVSLSVKEGFVEFRYNLGSGPVILRSAQKIQPGRYHRIAAKRYLRDGMLSIDGQENVSGKSQGMLNSLDLAQNLFLGYVPDAAKGILFNIGVSKGLIGCIRHFKIERKDVSLRYPTSREIIRGSHIRECSKSACSSMPCQNGGSCTATEEESYRCFCSPGFTGKQCETDLNPCSSNPCGQGSTCALMPQGGFSCKCPPGRSGRFCDKLHRDMTKVYVPDFTNHSFLEMPVLQNVGQAFTIEVWFLSRSPNGLLFYNGQKVSGKGDFISLNLVDSYVQFRYNLGSGIANITSRDIIELGIWHSVKVSRSRRQGTMKLNNETTVFGKSKSPLTELNLDQPLYIGGVPNLKHVNPESGVRKGLNGAIQRILVNGEIWDSLTSRAVRSNSVRRYRGPPCTSALCRHGGVCVPELNSFRCRCTMKYMGRKCEKRIRKKDMHRPIAFNGTTFLSFPYKNTKGSKSRKENRLQVRFRTNHQTGLLFWTNKGATLRGDYFAVALIDGYLELSYNLGKQRDHWAIRSNERVNDKLWHTLHVERKKRIGEIRIDNGIPISNISEPGATELNTDGLLWIGGSPVLPTGLPSGYYQGFGGCIDSILIDGNPLHLLVHGTADLAFCDHAKLR